MVANRHEVIKLSEYSLPDVLKGVVLIIEPFRFLIEPGEVISTFANKGDSLDRTVSSDDSVFNPPLSVRMILSVSFEYAGYVF